MCFSFFCVEEMYWFWFLWFRVHATANCDHIDEMKEKLFISDSYKYLVIFKLALRFVVILKSLILFNN